MVAGVVALIYNVVLLFQHPLFALVMLSITVLIWLKVIAHERARRAR